MTRVGFLGPGRMGRPMVERLLSVGHEVTVLARRPALREELASIGARVVTSGKDAVDGAEIVIACLFSDAQLLALADDVLAGLSPGAVLASHVTGSRATIQQLDARARRVGAGVVDAPVSGDVDEIRAGQLTVLLGGEPAAVEAADNVIAAYADPRLRTGGLGSALAAKLVNNLLFAAHVQTTAAAIALAEGLGVSQPMLVEVLNSASGGSYVARRLGAGAPAAHWADVVGKYLRKDVAACEVDLAQEGIDAGFLRQVVLGGPLSIAP